MLRKQDLIRWGIIDQALADAKAKLQRLANREGEYADLPAKIYYVYASDGTTANIYGLNHGDVDSDTSEGKDAIMAALRVSDWETVTNKGWLVSNGANTLTDDIINGLYVVDKPSLRCVWPLPQLIINNSSGYLNNDYLK